MAAISPDADRWATPTGLILLGVALVVAVWFYRRLALRIKRSERDFHALLEAAPFAIAVTRRHSGELLFANRCAIALLDLSATDYQSQRLPYADANHRRQLQDPDRAGGAREVEIDLLTSAGRRFPVLAAAAPITFHGLESTIGTFHDISKLKEAELKVRASEARLRAVFEAAPDGIVILAPDGTIRQASESCANLTGNYDISSSVGRSILDFLPENQRPQAREALAMLLAEQPRDQLAYHIVRADGTQVWIEPRGMAVLDPTSGQPTIVLVLRDVTQRKKAEEALAAHTAELQQALNQIAHLKNEILRVCAWTKQVNIDGQWIPIDMYLAKHLGLRLTHGISEAGLALLEKQQADPPKPRS